MLHRLDLNITQLILSLHNPVKQNILHSLQTILRSATVVAGLRRHYIKKEYRLCSLNDVRLSLTLEVGGNAFIMEL